MKKEKQDEKNALKDHRKNQYEVASYRDGHLCVICYFKHGRIRYADDVHHVFSRGNSVDDWRESYKSMMCVCRDCHPQPIKIKGGSANLYWVEELLDKANAHPINKGFIHVKDNED